MSLAPPLKFVAWLEEASTECPDVLSIAQIIRTLAILMLVAAAAGGSRLWALFDAIN